MLQVLESESPVTKPSVNIALLMFFALYPCVIMCYGLYVLKNTYLTMGLYHLLCLVPGIILGRHLWLKNFTVPTLKQWLVLLFSAVLFNATTIGLFEWIGPNFVDNVRVFHLINSLGFVRNHILGLSLYFIFVNSTLEELFWRGVVLNKVDEMQLRFKHAGILVSSVLYGLFHYFILRIVVNPGWAELGFVMLAIYGAILAVLYRRTKSILLPALVHGLLTDAAAMLLVLDLMYHYPAMM
ncbi:MAG TPA: CPBP family intramembrane glutamic endopeptidase [Drouetiella sp.]